MSFSDSAGNTAGALNGRAMRSSSNGRGPGGSAARPVRRLPLAVFASLLAQIALAAAATSTAAANGLVVIPRPLAQPGLSYFKLSASPGSSRSAGSIVLRNPTRGTMRVQLSTVDGQTLNTLGSSYAPPGTGAHGPGGWVALGSHAVRLAPGASVTVPIAVNVPPRARSGDYLGGVSIEALDQRPPAASRGAATIASVERYAIGVEVTLPGPRHPLISLTGADVQRQPAGLVFQVHARNSGNVILQGVTGEIRISHDGHTVLARAIEGGTFVTGTAIAYPIPAFAQVPPEGTRYRVAARLSYPGGVSRLTTSVVFGHRQALIQSIYGGRPAAAKGGTSVWKLAGALAVALYALTTTLLLARRRLRERRGGTPPGGHRAAGTAVSIPSAPDAPGAAWVPGAPPLPPPATQPLYSTPDPRAEVSAAPEALGQAESQPA